MLPSHSRKRPFVECASIGTQSEDETCPPKKRSTATAHLHQLSPPKDNQFRRAYGANLNKDLDKSSKAMALNSEYISKENLSKLLDAAATSRLEDPVSIESILKFPTTPCTSRSLSESISIASALKHPTELMPLTAEDRKLRTVQQLITEKLRTMQRDKLDLPKPPTSTPSLQETEICLNVVEVTNTDDSMPPESTTSVKYAALQDDTIECSDLFKLLLEKINKRSIINSNESIESPASTSPNNIEYAKQIEKLVVNKLIALRRNNNELKDCNSGRALYVVFVDGDEVKDVKPFQPPTESISDNDRRAQQFTEIFDTIFKNLSKESMKRNPPKPSAQCEPKLKKIRGVAWQKEEEERRNKTVQAKNQRRLGLKFYPSTTLDDIGTVAIGTKGTKISVESFRKINWEQWPTGQCTKKLLPEIFDKETMTTHSLWGTNTDNRVLCPDKIDDLVYIITDNKAGATVKDVHQAIIAKCYAHKRQATQKSRQNEPATDPTVP